MNCTVSNLIKQDTLTEWYTDANLETPRDEWAFDIPIAERIHEKVVEFDADAIAKLQERVPMWREYLNTLAL